jgi:hypothetical protein
MRAIVFLLAAASVAAFAQTLPRGQTPVPDQSQNWTHGRLGTQNPIIGKLVDLTGTLVDASCGDRSAFNLARPPEHPDIAPPPSPSQKMGGAVPPPDVASHLNRDLVTREFDESCAITGSTREFALVTPQGRLLNLDEGGNTLAAQAIYANSAGRAMLNGTRGGLKPQATVRGRVDGDRLIVDKIVKL